MTTRVRAYTRVSAAIRYRVSDKCRTKCSLPSPRPSLRIRLYSSTRYSFVIRVPSVRAGRIRIGSGESARDGQNRERERERERGRTDRKEKIERWQTAKEALSRISSTALNDLALGNLIDTGQTGGPDFKRPLALPPPLLPSSSSSSSSSSTSSSSFFSSVLPPVLSSAAASEFCSEWSIGRSVGRSAG